MSGFTPATVVVADVDEDPQIALGSGTSGAPYRAVWVIARAAGRPYGAFRLEGRRSWTSEQVRSAADTALGPPPDSTVPLASPACEQRAAVVIATRDRPVTLARTLLSVVAAGSGLVDEIVVVDNAGSSAATHRVVTDFASEHPEIAYVHEPTPGLARAHNTGVAASTADVVAITDDDVVADPRWLAAALAPFANPAVGAVTGLVLPLALDTPAQQWAEDSLGLAKGWHARSYDLGENRPEDPLFPFTAGTLGTGANMAFRRQTLDAIGGFDPDLGAGTPARGGDDLAAFHDVIADGWTLVYEPAAMIHHDHHRDRTGAERTAYGYGVALTAYLTRLAWRRGATAAMARRLPRGVQRALAAAPDGPSAPSRSLAARHRLGMLMGPIGYASSIRASRAAAGSGGSR